MSWVSEAGLLWLLVLLGGLWAGPPANGSAQRSKQSQESKPQIIMNEAIQLNLNEFVFVEWNEVKWNKTNHEFNWNCGMGHQAAPPARQAKGNQQNNSIQCGWSCEASIELELCWLTAERASSSLFFSFVEGQQRVSLFSIKEKTSNQQPQFHQFRQNKEGWNWLELVGWLVCFGLLPSSFLQLLVMSRRLL